MKHNAITRIVIYSLIIFILIALLIAGLGSELPVLHLGFSGGDFTLGEGSVPADQVSSLEIEWAAGNITIQTADCDTIIFSETGWKEESQKMGYRCSGGTLKIRHSAASVQVGFGSSPRKDLIITVPQSWICESLQIDSASTNATVFNLSIDSVELDSASNRFCFQDCSIGSLDIDGASNEIDLEGYLSSLDCDGISCRLMLILENTPDRITLDGMSTMLDLTLPQDCGFSVDMDGMSSHFSSEFHTTSHGGSYQYGNGHCRIDASGMSNSVTIRKAVS